MPKDASNACGPPRSWLNSYWTPHLCEIDGGRTPGGSSPTGLHEVFNPQTGIWCIGGSNIRISNYKVSRERPRVFVVMQFTPPYNELYSEVIVPVCNDLGLVAVRADETYGPGLIIADIAREIVEAKVIIADITPANLDVYYEVGYAYALRKPTILIAEKPTHLPFDVSPFRVLFYENTIGGKAKVEAGLRKHLDAIQTQWSAT